MMKKILNLFCSFGYMAFVLLFGVSALGSLRRHGCVFFTQNPGYSGTEFVCRKPNHGENQEYKTKLLVNMKILIHSAF